MLVAVALLPLGTAPGQLPTQQGDYTVVASYPHDPEAFTQGLEFKGTRLFETTGLEGRSTLRRVALESGTVKRKVALSDEHFGEGMTIFGRRLFWITWQTHKAFVYEPRTFRRTTNFTYPGEGWGLTHNGRALVMSDGSSELVFRDPKDFSVRRRITVKDSGEPIDRLNELEWVEGEVFANVWQTNRIARIDPSSGNVTGWIDISALQETEEASGDPDVPNGIAYIKAEKRLFVTGKFWRRIYEIELRNP